MKKGLLKEILEFIETKTTHLNIFEYEELLGELKVQIQSLEKEAAWAADIKRDGFA